MSAIIIDFCYLSAGDHAPDRFDIPTHRLTGPFARIGLRLVIKYPVMCLPGDPAILNQVRLREIPNIGHGLDDDSHPQQTFPLRERGVAGIEDLGTHP